MQNLMKRYLSFLLALIMVFSIMPVQVYAVDDSHDHAIEDENVTESVSSLIDQVRCEIAEYIEKYQLSTDMSDSDLADAYIELDSEQAMSAWYDVDAMIELAKDLTEAEVETLLAEENTELCQRFYAVIEKLNSPALLDTTGPHTPIVGVSVSVANGTNDTMDETGTITVTATGTTSTGCGGTNDVTTTATIKVYNDLDKKATLTFDWVGTDVNSLTINSESQTADSGTTEVILEAGGNIELTVTSGAGTSSTATFTMSNFKIEELAGSSNITFTYDATLGSISVGGEAVGNGDVKEVPLAGVELRATQNSETKFLGWTDANDVILSREATYQFAPEKDMEVKAVFAKTEPYFLVNNTYIVKGLTEAVAKGNTLVLMNDATLPAGDYTIPSGVTLLIPFDAANTLYTTSPAAVRTYATPSAYRTLTMANGATLTINGAMSLSAQHFAANGGGRGSGSPTGPVSFVKMEGNSAITINNGGALYAYGYITGSGSVTAESGAVVYENFQFEDFRGGTQTTGMENGVFPLSQYYVQNIEVPLTLKAGATEHSYTSLYMSSMTLGSSVAFISGSGAMFNLTSGSVTKRYDGSTDRLIVEADGTMSISPISMRLGIGILAQTINSRNYELPINGNITVKINDGSNVTISQDVALLPGSKIIIEEGATCTLGSGNNVYVYDADQWGNFCSSTNKTFLPVQYAPGRTHNRTAADLVDATIQIEGTMDASAGYIYTTSGGANIFSTDSGVAKIKPGTQTVTYQLVQNTGYTNIPITSAKLKNADGTYMETTITSGTYNYENGVWVKTCNHEYNETINTQAGCETEGLKTFTCIAGDYSYTEIIPATGHTEVVDAAVEPTCTETGLTEGKHCSVCNEVLAAQEVVPATGHTEVTDAAVEPTCTETGLTEGKHCSVCSTVLVAQEEIPALGHTPGDDATCTTAQICTVCHNELVAALGHDWDAGEIITDPTCTEDGEKFHFCNRCEETKTEVVDALGHYLITDEEKPATCTEPGYSTGSHCTRCDYTEGMTEIPALGHTEIIDAAVEATCIETGLTEGKHCSVCGEVLVAQEVVPTTGHTEAVDEAVEATCTKTGLTEGKHCSVCGEILLAQEIVPVTGHTEVINAARETSCKEYGLTEGKSCSVCGEILVAQEIIPALPHTEVIDEEIPAFCLDTGLTEGKHCSVCGEILVAQEVTPALGHDIVQYEAKKPTYGNVGWEAYEACSRGDYTTYVEIPALEILTIKDYETFMTNLALLEELAHSYVLENPGKDPVALVIKYIRTGVDRYNSGSWGIMAGYEDADFAEYVQKMEDIYNSRVESEDQMIAVSSLKNINNFTLPNGDYVDFGHMFGTMDITYHNKSSVNHADVGGWAGDVVDLLSLADQFGVGEADTVDEMADYIANEYLLKTQDELESKFEEALREGTFSQEDVYGDIDGYYIMQTLYGQKYTKGTLAAIFSEYFTEELNAESRASYLLKNRLNGASTRENVRNAVYNAYTGNKVIATLEGTREFTSDNLSNLRKASCYAFADYLCKLAGDFVDVTENPYYTVFSSEFSNLAPGITQEIKYATSADNKQMVYYIATADITRDDVNVYANYNDNDPGAGWAMSRVEDQVAAAQEKYGDPESEYYIENYNVIVSTNGAGFNMSTGEPGGLLVMGGVEYQSINANGFFGILKDGTPVIGTTEEYNTIYKGEVQEGIAGFGSTLVKDGKICINRTETYYTDRAPRTAVGITKTGKVVLMVLDGRQEPFSCGGSMQEIAQIMLEAGCVEAINLDGGGSSTFVAKQEGDDEVSVINRPSDGFARSVSTSLMMVSTAPNSTAFDHANMETETDYLTIGTSVQITPVGVSATGNTAELPEGTTWAVSDERWGTITDDGVFTALRSGDVEISLMLGDAVIGSKTMHVVVPDNVYFTRTNMNAVYGETVELPVKALYQGKEVAINANDIAFTLSNTAAGAVEGFNFVINEESNIKNVRITAALASNSNVTAAITVALYNQGEVSFDFDQATGGDRQLAWDRKVYNSTTEDGVTYTIENSEDPMVTAYTFAIDMTQIPIPQQLADLTYMLPGADVEGASAWTFLLQLAERVSVLSEVKPVLRFDENFDIDYSGLTLVNEYFDLNGVVFDEENNELTLTLNWKDQTKAIDPTTANPICIVNGIKLTPKEDAVWTKDRLTAVNSGEISYKIYLRANALYSFAQKKENQELYGVYPFVNPNDESESGGYFGDVYKEFNDTYTLDRTVKDGWVNVDGGFAYYKDGVKFTGVQEIDGFYYDFGENGINVGQTTYTGVFFDEDDGVYRYSKFGVLTSGWNMIGTDWYYFNSSSMAAVSGRVRLGGVYYEFEENGKLVSGVWVNTLNGIRYYYGPSYYTSYWQTIDGELYYFKDGYRLTGVQYVRSQEISSIKKWYNFGEDGICRDVVADGLHEIDGKLYYTIDGVNQIGLQKVDGDYYFFTYAGPAVCGQSYYAWETHCDLPCSTYAFGPDGKMVNGLAQMNDGVYYYVNGKVVSNAAGLTKIGDDYYFVSSIGRCATGKYYAWATNCDLPVGNYEFGADGKMLQGIVEKEDGVYYYVNGKISSDDAGLTKVGDDYYFVSSIGRCATGKYYAWATNCDLPVGNYEFGADGKMLQGIVEKEDGVYYYINGKITSSAAGLTKVGDDYYFVSSIGRCATGTYYAWATNCDLPVGNYEFGADGKMLQGIVEKENGVYYYVNGKLGGNYAGLTKVGDDYYFVASNGRCATGTYYAWATNCDLPCSTYEFGADGKMLHGFIETENGVYCYVNGKLGGNAAGLTKIGDDYYFVATNGKCATGKYYAWATNCDLPVGNYEFGADGKMLNGFVTKDDGIYYYVNGKTGTVGLNYIDGYYYFVSYSGKIVTNQSYYVWETNGLLLETTYTFDEYGRIIG